VFDVPRPDFLPKGITHREEANGKPGDPERLAIMIDLKDVPASTAPLATAVPPAFPRDGARNVLENARIRMWDYTWPVDAPAREVQYAADAVEVVVTGGTLVNRGADGRDTPRAGAEGRPLHRARHRGGGSCHGRLAAHGDGGDEVKRGESLDLVIW
jgi:hypothetical protein